MSIAIGVCVNEFNCRYGKKKLHGGNALSCSRLASYYPYNLAAKHFTVVFRNLTLEPVRIPKRYVYLWSYRQLSSRALLWHVRYYQDHRLSLSKSRDSKSDGDNIARVKIGSQVSFGQTPYQFVKKTLTTMTINKLENLWLHVIRYLFRNSRFDFQKKTKLRAYI